MDIDQKPISQKALELLAYRGYPEEQVALVSGLFEKSDPETRSTLAKALIFEQREVIDSLLDKLEEIKTAVQESGEGAAKIIMNVAKGFK